MVRDREPWEAGELRTLRTIRGTGVNSLYMAKSLGRSEGAVKSMLYSIDIADLLQRPKGTTLKDLRG